MRKTNFFIQNIHQKAKWNCLFFQFHINFTQLVTAQNIFHPNLVTVHHCLYDEACQVNGARSKKMA